LRIEIRQDAWKAWIAAGLWLVLIAVESTDLLSANNTGRFLYALFTSLFGHINPATFLHWHHIARKLGHVVGYGILRVLLFRAWQASLRVDGAPRWSLRWAQVALLMTAIVASLDEWHQSFIPSRTGTWRDVVLDSAAALAAQFILYLFLRRWRVRVPQEVSL
jgi:VanZ family protein